MSVDVSVDDTVWNVTCQGRQGSPSRCNKPRLRCLRPPEPTPIESGRAAAAAAAVAAADITGAGLDVIDLVCSLGAPLA